MTVLLAFLAAYRITRLVTTDTITQPVRNRLLSRWPSDDTVFTDEYVTETSGGPRTIHGAEVEWLEGQGWIAVRPRWFGTLITCNWCASMWIGTLLTVGLWAVGALTMGWYGWVMLPLGLSAVTGLLSGWE